MFSIPLCSKHFIQRCVQDCQNLVPINASDSRLLFQGHIRPLPNNCINKQTNKTKLNKTYLYFLMICSHQLTIQLKMREDINFTNQYLGSERLHPGTKIVMWQILNRWKKVEKKMKKTRCFFIYWPNFDKKHQQVQVQLFKVK